MDGAKVNLLQTIDASSAKTNHIYAEHGGREQNLEVVLTCTHTHTPHAHVHTHIHTHTHSCTQMPSYVHTKTYAHTHKGAHTRTHIRTHTYTHIYTAHVHMYTERKDHLPLLHAHTNVKLKQTTLN